MNSLSQTDPLEQVAAEWHRVSEPLADWAFLCLLNRPAHVRYLELEKRSDGGKVITKKLQPTRDELINHFQGRNVGNLIALHSTSPKETCRWIAIDLDCHADDFELGQRNTNFAIVLANRLLDFGFAPLVLDSDGRGGFHILVIFNEPIPAVTAYRFAKWLVLDWRNFGVSEPETLPKRPSLAGQKYGTALRLPGRHHTRPHWTRVLTPSGWLCGGAAAKAILTSPLHLPHRIPEAARNYQPMEELLRSTAPLMPPPPQPRRLSQPVESGSPVGMTYSPDAIRERAKNYLDKAAPAIAGQQGDSRFWKVACAFFRAFSGLSVEDALPLFREWNGRCQPPFADNVVWDKLQRASFTVRGQ